MAQGNFRCPFDTYGSENNTEIHTRLTSSNELGGIATGVSSFLSDTTKTALRILLPDGLSTLAGGNRELKGRLMPYSVELSASILEHQLYPFLPYQNIDYNRKLLLSGIDPLGAIDSLSFLKPELIRVVMALTKSIESLLKSDFKTREDLRTFIGLAYLRTLSKNIESNPMVFIHDRDPEGPLRNSQDQIVCRFQYSGAHEYPIYHRSQGIRQQGRERELDTFAIVTTPYYKPDWGRFSEKPSIVLTRASDFEKLPENARRKIRHDSNLVLANDGYQIEDLYEDMQPAGLWLPDES